MASVKLSSSFNTSFRLVLYVSQVFSLCFATRLLGPPLFLAFPTRVSFAACLAAAAYTEGEREKAGKEGVALGTAARKVGMATAER